MDGQKKVRRPVRASFTRTFTKLMASIASADPDKDLILVDFNKIERLQGELNILDKRIVDLLLIDDATEEVFEEERATAEEYQDKMDLIRVKVQPFLNSRAVSPSLSSTTQCTSSETGKKRKFKLPKLELIKFGGELREWLGFWGLFRKIHEDDDIATEDKFQYLLQATIKGSRARDVVESFPPTADNYPKAVDSLKSRFGRDDLLVEVYVRELLQLVISNATSKEKSPLSKLYDKLESHLRSLESIGVASEKCAAMLFPLMESSIPEETLRAWQRSTGFSDSGGISSSVNPSEGRLSALMTFLRTEVEGEERITLARTGFKANESQWKSKKKFGEEIQDSSPTATSLYSGSSEDKKVVCVFCENGHDSKDCFQAQRMTLSQKKATLSKKRCCYTCFKTSHQSKMCKATLRCVVCGRRHFTIMCPEVDRKSESRSTVKKEGNFSSMSSLSSSNVKLQTLMVLLTSEKKEGPVRAIIDTGSQQSYLLQRCAREFGLSPVGTKPLSHGLFGGEVSSRHHLRYHISLRNLNKNFECKIHVWDQPIICNEIPRIRKGDWFKELKEKKVWLTDVGEEDSEIELLIGADFAGRILTGRVQQLSSGLTAVETQLGWTIMGMVSGSRNDVSMGLLNTCLLIQESTISDLWRLDVIGITDPIETKSREELQYAAKIHFENTVKISSDGRYEVALPFLEGHPEIVDNKIMAEKRLISSTRRLICDGKYADYDMVFKEWMSENIIEEVPDFELEKFGFYLPHRGVFKEAGTTKIRPVFDASAKFRNSPSLNDCLEKGENLLEKIPNVLMRFRENNIGVISDIRKAFLQISVRKEDCDFLRFLWWKDDFQKEIKVFRHRRVVFGVICSPFLLGSVIVHHLESSTLELQKVAKKLLHSLYVDNCVTSVKSESELSNFVQASTQLMASACFDLRGWEYTGQGSSAHGTTTVLGLKWDKLKDELFVEKVDVGDLSGPISKRNILSIANKFFDPIGFTCPVSVCPKLLLQQTWGLKIGWDQEVPEEVSTAFKKWTADLHLISEVKIPRLISMGNSSFNWSLHIFCDASKFAYSAVVYLRSESIHRVSVRLVQAKSRVAPIKKITIPRLELLACTIGSRLADTVQKSFGWEKVPTFFWSDSTTVLCWISKEEAWGTFVLNRVKEIRKLTSSGQWRHVPGERNPADLPSRGCSTRQLLQSKWWEGPAWLSQAETSWPKKKKEYNSEEVNEEKKKTVVSSLLSLTGDQFWFLKYFSTYSKIIRMVCWILRFANNARCRPELRVNNELSVSELEDAERRLLCFVQTQSLANKENITSLPTYTDEAGIIRVKTKILRRQDLHDFKRPIVLPFDHPLVELLVREEHLRSSHAGVQFLLSSLRERFWILQGRKTIRKVILKCIACRRHNTKKIESASATLPEDRVRDASAFEVGGVDLVGPLFLKDGGKAWIVLFTCAVYRAVHLELISSLSTDAFLQALRRFIARRGRPSTIYSDNGTNFVGSENLFRSSDWTEIQRQAAARRIQWKFNPPTAAWWGGFWERLVRMIKNLLKRVLGRSSLSYEELMTTLCDCESILNSRPLTYVSEDSQDLVPLTPAMFIQDITEIGVPDIDSIDAASLNKRLRYRQRLKEDLRQRFRTEYLGQLVDRAQEKGGRKSLKIGDVVLVGSDNVKRLHWPMARVIELCPGKDKEVRVVRLKTNRGELLRPVQRVYPLEVSSDELVISKKVKVGVVKGEPPAEVVTRSGRVVKRPHKFSV